ncbi:beta-lactamase [Cordyceps fumosorosea ARSEF 2679]|uniref:Beta-lactamase n=1 Tax=Cordyceps fumosorosea (strain ARSEF 2679) TaxID=1081104 RepID=A0A167VRV4_CORFA|nr:beta-lactamase [Cordyceps fumosorosea ARSEF 2679]OAA62917.1 beta-lactamase [Cordyceps fumosorosea ARSEF 2679]
MATVQGTNDPRFDELRSIFQQRLDSGDELGASITVNIDGENVVDLWGGHTSRERTAPWERDTIVNVWSSSKTIISFAILMLVDRGLLDVHENVATYWPEFAANGKEHVKVRHLLSHTSGLSGWEAPLAREDLYDREKATALLAAQAPWWEPGAASGYHSLTMGFLLGELVVRVTGGKTMRRFIADEIAAPLGVDFQLGAAEPDWPRVATLDTGDSNGDMALPPGAPELTVKTLGNPAPNANAANTPGWRRAEIGAANGHANSRALARIMSAIALGGEVDGVRLLSPATIDLIFQEQAHGVDMVIHRNVQFGIGFGICTAGDSAVNEILPRGRVCYWSGWGGSMVAADTERRLTFSYTMNKMWINSGTLGNPNTVAYGRAVYAALGVKVGTVELEP